MLCEMRNSNETKDMLVLRKLREVQRYHEGLGSRDGNIFKMARDSADVIDDLHKEIQILQRELMAEKIAHNEDLCVMGSGPIPEDRTNVFEEQRKMHLEEVREVIGIDLDEEAK